MYSKKMYKFRFRFKYFCTLWNSVLADLSFTLVCFVIIAEKRDGRYGSIFSQRDGGRREKRGGEAGDWKFHEYVRKVAERAAQCEQDGGGGMGRGETECCSSSGDPQVTAGSVKHKYLWEILFPQCTNSVAV